MRVRNEECDLAISLQRIAKARSSEALGADKKTVEGFSEAGGEQLQATSIWPARSSPEVQHSKPTLGMLCSTPCLLQRVLLSNRVTRRLPTLATNASPELLLLIFNSATNVSQELFLTNHVLMLTITCCVDADALKLTPHRWQKIAIDLFCAWQLGHTICCSTWLRNSSRRAFRPSSWSC